MKAIVLTANNTVELQNVPKPSKAAPGHLLIKMQACGINPGDISFLGRVAPLGAVTSLHSIYGVSGVGMVLEAGEGVPDRYLGKNVVMYRSLKPSTDIAGTWTEYSVMHYLDCAILPDDVNIEDYSGSLVNIITPFSFLKTAVADGHNGIIATAGSSATGIAMLGICLAYGVPLVSIVRDEAGKQELEALGAVNVAVQAEPNFKEQLRDMAQAANATAVFDGVGGYIINAIIDVVPNGSTFYSYGFLGGAAPLSFHTSMLMRGITIKGFSNFRSQTVMDPKSLEQALTDISAIIHMPHFKTKIGQRFPLKEIQEALKFTDSKGGKAVLYP